MQEKLKTTFSPFFEGFTALINRLDQLFIYPSIHEYGDKLASEYWSKLQIHGQMNPQEKLIAILNNQKNSNWFEVFEIKQSENELKIVHSGVETKSKNDRYDFFTGFIDELIKNAYQMNDPAKVEIDEGYNNTG